MGKGPTNGPEATGRPGDRVAVIDSSIRRHDGTSREQQEESSDCRLLPTRMHSRIANRGCMRAYAFTASVRQMSRISIA